MQVSRQIGWSNESNLLYQILKQLNKLTSVLFNLKPKYKVFTATLTQSGGTNPSTTQGDEYLFKGVSYSIENLEPGDNLIPYGAPNNDVGTYFICNQDVPVWGSPLSTVSWNSGTPIVNVLENTIGNDIHLEYNDVGRYSFYINNNLPELPLKVFVSVTPNNDNEVNIINISIANGRVVFSVYDNTFSSQDDLLINVPIEIRLYN